MHTNQAFSLSDNDSGHSLNHKNINATSWKLCNIAMYHQDVVTPSSSASSACDDVEKASPASEGS